MNTKKSIILIFFKTRKNDSLVKSNSKSWSTHFKFSEAGAEADIWTAGQQMADS